MAKEEKNKNPTGTEKILEDAREGLKSCIDAEESERKKMADDLRFAALDQWPAEIRKDREGDIENGPRPCLTIDKLNQYIVQVVNDVRQGRPGINVRPQDDNADVETARILKGIIRNIEDQSSADIAYGMGVENAAKIGLGFFRVTTEYISDEKFNEQEIFIRPIPNTFAVYLGEHIMPDGSDAESGYIVEAMPIEKFKTENPNAKSKKDDFDSIESSMLATWKTEDTITVVEEYKFEKVASELLFLDDGTTVPAEMYAQWPADLPKPAVQDRRTTFKKKLKWRKMTGVEILDSRDLPGKYIPIVEVIGRETRIDGKRILWGLVRPAKDSLRMYNYFASTITEKMGLSPKTPYIVAKGQLENFEDRWKKANKINYAYLEYNPVDNASGNSLPAPMRQAPTPMEAAYFHFMQVIEHDVQTSLGMFKAAVGETESQQSGRALLALQRESDMGTAHFGANLGISIRHCGRIIVDLIPHYYDTKRIVRILGEDGEVQNVQLDPSQEQAHRQIQTQQGMQSIHNPSVGKYDVSVESGPSYTTKRLEATTMYVEMAKGASDPGSAAVLHYLIAKNSDSAGSQEATRMLRALLPPQVLQAMATGQQIPPEALAEMQKMQQAMQAMHQEGQKLQQENMRLKGGVDVAQIKAESAQQIEAMRLQAEERDNHMRQMFEEQSAKLDHFFDRWKEHIQAQTKVEVAEIAAGAAIDAAQVKAAHQATAQPA